MPRLQSKSDALIALHMCRKGRACSAFLNSCFHLFSRTPSWSAPTSTTMTATSPTAPSAVGAERCSCVATTTAAGPYAPSLGESSAILVWSGNSFLFHVNRNNSAINAKHYLFYPLLETELASSAREYLFTRISSLLCRPYFDLLTVEACRDVQPPQHNRVMRGWKEYCRPPTAYRLIKYDLMYTVIRSNEGGIICNYESTLSRLLLNPFCNNNNNNNKH